MKVLFIFGTRPEAIKMAPVILAFQSNSALDTIICVTAQHRRMLDEALNVFGIVPHYDLDIMRSGQSLSSITTAALEKLTMLVGNLKPDRAIVHGDTTTTFAASLACFYCGVPVGHVEAGLRTGNLNAPWPEEFNRRVTDMIADMLWAPTDRAAAALIREGADRRAVKITGNTVIDALTITKDRLESDENLLASLWSDLPRLDANKRLVLVTGHRRESFGGGIANMCEALSRLCARPDIEVAWPVHPNPHVLTTVRDRLSGTPNFHLLAPQDYFRFVALMMRSTLIITDSGGVQEEAPALGKPVLVTRTETERPEAIEAGTAKLVGTGIDEIVNSASTLLDNPALYHRMAKAKNPFGDGRAASRILYDVLEKHGLVTAHTTSRTELGPS